ncbi:MAG: hypothetical protein CL768_00810 [Chloroflexi bacterium]|nr:hypothetical protein [Chloroflexota bacterium]
MTSADFFSYGKCVMPAGRIRGRIGNHLIKLHISNPSITPPIAPTTRNQLSLTQYVIFLFLVIIFI